MDKPLDFRELIGVLIELRSASMQMGADPSEEKIRSTMRKYDMIFAGGEFGIINSLELCHSLKSHFKMKIDNGELNALIPEACRVLGMECEPMIKVSDVGKSAEPYCYEIALR